MAKVLVSPEHISDSDGIYATHFTTYGSWVITKSLKFQLPMMMSLLQQEGLSYVSNIWMIHLGSELQNNHLSS